MKIYNPRDPLISIHIPKCAGSSFTVILKNWFNKGYLPHYHNEIENTPPEKYKMRSKFLRNLFGSRICIHGHFNHERGNGVQDYYPDITQFITFVRDPFDVHLSNYFFVKKNAKKDKKIAYRAGTLRPLTDDSVNIKDYLGLSKKSFMGAFFSSEINLNNYQEILERDFVYIGVVEKFQESVDILAEKLGFPTVIVPQENVSNWTEIIPEGAREEFMANNPLEMAIYEYALSNFGNSA